MDISINRELVSWPSPDGFIAFGCSRCTWGFRVRHDDTKVSPEEMFNKHHCEESLPHQ